MTALVFEGVRKVFGPTVALEELDLALAPGEFVSLLGPSGCGKTTALRIAAGFERPNSGKVRVLSNDITHLPAHRRNMGMVFQSYSLFPNLNVRGNVEFGLRTRKVGPAERSTRVNDILDLVQLGSLADRYPHQLSGGQQQRVALARALAVRPEVLLLDEPLSALDAKVRASLRQEIRQLQKELGITTLFVTHDQEEALAISDRVGVMSNGRLEQLAAPREIYRRPASAFVARFVGSMNEVAAVALDPSTVRVGTTPIGVPSTGVAAGSSVRLLVRPEDLRLTAISPSGGRPNSDLVGHVTLLTFQGASTVASVRLQASSQLLAVHLSGGTESVTVGDLVEVGVDGSNAVCEPI
jgi:putative spermidine/putrescine transport system ATP-binding protein